MKSKEILKVGALGFVIGGGMGYILESHTNEVAAEKIVTLEACKKRFPIDGVITVDFEKCVREGNSIPGGTKIGSKGLKAGNPADYVDAYVATQKLEASKLELNRVLAWGISVPAAVAVWYL